MISTTPTVTGIDKALRHIKLLYCIALVIFLCQISTFIYFYHCLSKAETEYITIHGTRLRRETANLFGDNAITAFEDWRIPSRNNSRKAIHERTRNLTKIISKDDDGMITIGHATRIPVETGYGSDTMSVSLRARAGLVKRSRCLVRYLAARCRRCETVEARLRVVTAVLVCVVVCEVAVVVYLYVLAAAPSQPLARTKRESAVLENTVGNPESELSVEFVNPKLRAELEEKEKFNGSKTEKGANPWVWLTSYSRVPVYYMPQELKL
ncbi:extracellular matrix binding [Homalodisca vitripennis]|nr:extracellular matrix binding [Homalodisca vitripennis]